MFVTNVKGGSTLILLSLAMSMWLAACSSRTKPIQNPIQTPVETHLDAHLEAVTNSDITWYFTPDGLEPNLNVFAEQLLLTLENKASGANRAQILAGIGAYLEDPDRYIVAQDILTFLSGRPYTSTNASWNELQFSAQSTIPVEKQFNRIRKLWADVL